MNPLYFRTGSASRSGASMLALNEWQEKEKVNPLNCAVDQNGDLLDNLTLELRIHPPEITINNKTDEKHTVVTLTSANRPGSLIHVVQHFMELGLRIHSSRVTSCGGWFVDVFYLTESNNEKVWNLKKLASIQQMLNVYMREEEAAANGDETDDMSRVETTVFEVAGPDRPGLLDEVVHLLTHNGCDVRSAAVWTYRKRVAFVLSVTEKGSAVRDEVKLMRLRQLMTGIVGDMSARVASSLVRGEVHHDRRLHQQMLREECEAWAIAGGDGGLARPSDSDSDASDGTVLACSVADTDEDVESLGGSRGGSSKGPAGLRGLSAVGLGLGGLGSGRSAPSPARAGLSVLGGVTGAGGAGSSAASGPGHMLMGAAVRRAPAPAAPAPAPAPTLASAAAAPAVPATPSTPIPAPSARVGAGGALTSIEVGGRAPASAAASSPPSASSSASTTTAAAVAEGLEGRAGRAPAGVAGAGAAAPYARTAAAGRAAAGGAAEEEAFVRPAGVAAPGAAGQSSPSLRSPKYERPEVDVWYDASCQYWIVSIVCKNRNKLLFDTVCTLADLDYDIWHATIEATEGDRYSQEYYVRPRDGDRQGFDADKARLLRAMLASSIRRRFPRGLKLHVHSLDRYGSLAELTRVMRSANLTITRAKVRTFATSRSAGHTFYVMDASGRPPNRDAVEAACRKVGGNLVEAGKESYSVSLGSHRFSFSFLRAEGSSPHSSSYGSL